MVCGCPVGVWDAGGGLQLLASYGGVHVVLPLLQAPLRLVLQAEGLHRLLTHHPCVDLCRSRDRLKRVGTWLVRVVGSGCDHLMMQCRAVSAGM